jgi:hypothetical protein
MIRSIRLFNQTSSGCSPSAVAASWALSAVARLVSLEKADFIPQMGKTTRGEVKV